MAKLNKVFLIGNLTKDPELRYTPGGAAIVEFGMAMNRTWQGPDGEKKEEVCFVQVVMFGKRAEVINEYFNKGNPIFIEGRLQFNQWETNEGQKRNTLKVVAEDFQFIGGKPKGNSENREQGDPDMNEEYTPF
jgi:single-strand DNA-binding protein